MVRKLVPAFAAASALLLLAACSGSGNGSSSTNSAGGGSVANPTSATGAAGSGTGAVGSGTSAAPAGTTTSSAGGGGQTVTVNMTDANQFQPTTVTVPRGGTVNWVNTGTTTHTVTDDASKAAKSSDAVLPSGAQAWDSGNVNGGASYSLSFDTPGQYTYFCIPHESLGMVAHITVTP